MHIHVNGLLIGASVLSALSKVSASLCGLLEVANLTSPIDQEVQSRDIYPRLEASAIQPVSIDVFMHLIGSSETSQIFTNETHSRLLKQIEVLNDSYRTAKFSFNLKDTDRTVNASWAKVDLLKPGTDHMTRTLQQGNAHTLNLYFVEEFVTIPSEHGATDCAGYEKGIAPVGSCWAPWPPIRGLELIQRGCIVDFRAAPGGSLPTRNQGKTAVHEVGHWLGLKHTFALGGTTDKGCNGVGDGISDTPASVCPSEGCQADRNSCPLQPGLDPVRNYMDYSDDYCLTEFTPQQIQKMHENWNLYLAKMRS